MLKELGLFSLEKAQRGLAHVYKYLMAGNEEEGERIFSVVRTDRTRGNEHKLKTGNSM